MKAKLIKVDKFPSRNGDNFYALFFTDEKQSYRCYLSDKYRNYSRWKKPLELLKDGAVWLDNLTIKRGDLIDGDSDVKLISEPLKPNVVICPLFGRIDYDKARKNLHEAMAAIK